MNKILLEDLNSLSDLFNSINGWVEELHTLKHFNYTLEFTQFWDWATVWGTRGIVIEFSFYLATPTKVYLQIPNAILATPENLTNKLSEYIPAVKAWDKACGIPANNKFDYETTVKLRLMYLIWVAYCLVSKITNTQLQPQQNGNTQKAAKIKVGMNNINYKFEYEIYY